MSTKAKHGTNLHQEVADKYTILRGQVGSGLHGITVPGTDDRDEMGICIEPPEQVIGLDHFEQYIFRTQPDGARSGPGDLDLVIYSLRKWTRLAAGGNPTVLAMLWLPTWEIMVCDRYGDRVQGAKDLFVTKEAGRKFLGYLYSQHDGLTGTGNKHTNRPELIEQYGYDTKYAYHAIRLGIQGIEALKYSHVNYPMLSEHRDYLLSVRRGEVDMTEVIQRVEDLAEGLKELIARPSFLPSGPDHGEINRWLTQMYTEYWSENALI